MRRDAWVYGCLIKAVATFECVTPQVCGACAASAVTLLL
jgi:hypothetical protein